MSSELNQINEQIAKVGGAFEEFKKTQDALDAKIASGEAGQAELKEKLEKMNESMNQALEMKKTIEETQAYVKRMGGQTLADQLENEGTDAKAFQSGMQKWMAKGMPQNVESIDLSESEKKALQSNIDPQGGYTVNPYYGAIEKRLFDTSPVRSVASQITIGTNEYVGYHDDNEFGAGWVGEIDTRSETSTADLGEFRIPVREMYARFVVSDRLLEDSSWNIESWASGNVADKFGRVEATAFVSGNGPLQPEGLLTATQKGSNQGDYTRGQVGTLTAASATAIATDELVTLRGFLKSGYRGNAYFAYNRNTEAAIRKLKDGQGNYIWQPSYQAGEADMLLGQRTIIFEDMPDIATGALSVVLADFRDCYQIVDRAGMSTLKDPYTQAVNGRTVYHMRKRVGGGFKSFDSIKYLKQA
jgi:HK97 family phage major capsid protein